MSDRITVQVVQVLPGQQRIQIRIDNGTQALDARSTGPRLAWQTEDQVLLLMSQLAHALVRLRNLSEREEV